MHPKTLRRIRLFLATVTVGMCLQGVFPQGCLGLLQQNIEAGLRTQAVVGPELYQSWIFKILSKGL
jgi:hypothetical protein